MTGATGFLASIMASHWSEYAGAFTALATGIYMTLRAVREWAILRQQLRTKELHDELTVTRCTRATCKMRENDND